MGTHTSEQFTMGEAADVRFGATSALISRIPLGVSALGTIQSRFACGRVVDLAKASGERRNNGGGIRTSEKFSLGETADVIFHKKRNDTKKISMGVDT